MRSLQNSACTQCYRNTDRKTDKGLKDANVKITSDIRDVHEVYLIYHPQHKNSIILLRSFDTLCRTKEILQKRKPWIISFTGKPKKEWGSPTGFSTTKDS